MSSFGEPPFALPFALIFAFLASCSSTWLTRTRAGSWKFLNQRPTECRNARNAPTIVQSVRSFKLRICFQAPTSFDGLTEWILKPMVCPCHRASFSHAFLDSPGIKQLRLNAFTWPGIHLHDVKFGSGTSEANEQDMPKWSRSQVICIHMHPVSDEFLPSKSSKLQGRNDVRHRKTRKLASPQHPTRISPLDPFGLSRPVNESSDREAAAWANMATAELSCTPLAPLALRSTPVGL